MPEGQPASVGFFSRKFMGIPAIVWLAGAALLAYMYFRHQSSTGAGGTSTGGGGSAATGDITLQPSPTSITVQGQYGPNTTGPVSNVGNPPPRHGTGNPQPKPPPKPPKKKHVTTIKTPPKKPNTREQFVTVAKWPGKSSGGLAQWNTTLWGIANHQHTTVAHLLQLNPQIKNANLVKPGEKIRVS